MITLQYSISFDYMLDDGAIQVSLSADVEEDRIHACYLIKNFRVGQHHSGSLLPEVQIKKMHGVWVHRESEKETSLSEAIGKAIDAYLLPDEVNGQT